MKPMTEKQIMNSTLKELGFYLDPSLGNCLTIPSENGYIRVKTKTIGIELVQEKPEINIKNLGLFMAKFGEYPEALFSHGMCINDGSEIGFLHDVDTDKREPYQDHLFKRYIYCEIFDPRWNKENLEASNERD